MTLLIIRAKSREKKEWACILITPAVVFLLVPLFSLLLLLLQDGEEEKKTTRRPSISFGPIEDGCEAKRGWVSLDDVVITQHHAAGSRFLFISRRRREMRNKRTSSVAGWWGNLSTFSLSPFAIDLLLLLFSLLESRRPAADESRALFIFWLQIFNEKCSPLIT